MSLPAPRKIGTCVILQGIMHPENIFTLPTSVPSTTIQLHLGERISLQGEAGRIWDGMVCFTFLRCSPWAKPSLSLQDHFDGKRQRDISLPRLILKLQVCTPLRTARADTAAKKIHIQSAAISLSPRASCSGPTNSCPLPVLCLP